MGRGCWRYRRPIERDESREWLVWLWYRFWQYKRKFGSGILVKSWSKSQKMLESGREKSPEGRNARKSVQNLIFYRLRPSEQTKSRLNEPKQSNPVKNQIFHFSGGSDTKQTPPCVQCRGPSLSIPIVSLQCMCRNDNRRALCIW